MQQEGQAAVTATRARSRAAAATGLRRCVRTMGALARRCTTGDQARPRPGAVNLHPPRVRPRRRKNTVKTPGSRWTAERSPECGSLPLLCRTSTSLGACGWSTGCLVLSSVRGLQMNVCRINGAQHLVERSHECPRRSDQTISMHTRRPYRVWMGLSPSIELNNANGKSVHMPRRIAQSSNG